MADEEGIHLLEVAQTGLVFGWMVQDLKTESHQFLSGDLLLPWLLRFSCYVHIILIVIKVKQPLGLTLYALYDFLFLLDLTLLWFCLSRWLEEEFNNFWFLISQYLMRSKGSLTNLRVLKFLIRDIKGQLYHPGGKDTMCAAVVGELEQVRPDLGCDVWDGEQLLSRYGVVTQHAFD